MIPFDENEHIVHELRRHWFSMFNYAVMIFVIALLPAIGGFIAVNVFSVELTTKLLVLGLFIWSVWLTCAWVIFFIEWTDFYLDLWIITNKRVIDIDQKGLFKREIATVRIENIQDVKIEVSGILATFLQLGDIHLQTAGEQREFALDAAYKPEVAKNIINQVLDEKTQIHESAHPQPSVLD